MSLEVVLLIKYLRIILNYECEASSLPQSHVGESRQSACIYIIYMCWRCRRRRCGKRDDMY